MLLICFSLAVHLSFLVCFFSGLDSLVVHLLLFKHCLSNIIHTGLLFTCYSHVAHLFVQRFIFQNEKQQTFTSLLAIRQVGDPCLTQKQCIVWNIIYGMLCIKRLTSMTECTMGCTTSQFRNAHVPQLT